MSWQDVRIHLFHGKVAIMPFNKMSENEVGGLSKHGYQIGTTTQKTQNFMRSPFQRSKFVNSHFFVCQNVTRPPLP
jgi:hypothetical protein